MNQQNRVSSSCAALELPMKRKRGRPRKDKSPEKENDIDDKSEIENMTTQPAEEDPIVGDTEDEMVGQVVSGVLEGSFDAGYLITVKAGNTDSVMKGLVFLPSKITPLTAANDVAPQAKLYTRKDIPTLALKPHMYPQVCIPQLKQDDQPSGDFGHGMLAAENPVSISQDPGDGISLGDRTPKIDNHLHAGAAVGVPNLSASVRSQAKDSGREEQKEQFKIGPQPSVEKNFEFSSALSNRVVPNVEMGNQTGLIQDKAEKFDARVKNIVQPDRRSSNDEPNTCCNSDNPEGIINKQGTDGEVPVCPNKDTATDTQPPSVLENLNRDSTSCFDQKPVNHGTGTTEAEPRVAQSVSLSVENSQAELVTAEDKQGTNENLSTVIAQISSTSGLSMNVECTAEAVAHPQISANLCQQTHQSGDTRETQKPDICYSSH